MNDFKKFANDKMVSTSYLNDYFRKINIRNNTTQLIESNGISVDIFSKLLDDRIIFLCTEIDSDICNIIKAQLMY